MAVPSQDSLFRFQSSSTGSAGSWGFHLADVVGSRSLPRVLVLGAGMAGLVAARILHDTGFTVQVIEARDRLGGRIWTVTDRGIPLDMGASWIHGMWNNPLVAWCRREGIPLKRFPRGDVHMWAEGRSVSLMSLLRRGRLGLRRCILRFLQLILKKMNPAKGSGCSPSLSDLFLPLIRDPSLPELDRKILLWLMTLEEAINGAPAHSVSLTELVIPNDWIGNAVPLPGYETLIRRAAEGLSILFQSPVRSITLSEGSVVVETSHQTHRADVVVVTFPVGVLRDSGLRFSPPLPQAKMKALERIGYGKEAVLNKAAVRLERFPCPTHQQRLGQLPKDLSESPSFVLWTHMGPLLGNPVLMGYTSGKTAARMDLHDTDEELQWKVKQSLFQMFGKRLPEIRDLLVTRWLSDPWARGSYSYETPRNTSDDRKELARPIANRIFFAGEATHPIHYGTVHGALLSGEEAAKKIHEIYCCGTRNTPSAPWH